MLTRMERDGVTFAVEDDWLCMFRREPSLAGKSAAELLALGERLPGNFRHATESDGGVFLLGEVRIEVGESALQEAQERLFRLLEQRPGGYLDLTDEDALEAALDASGFVWTRRESGWALPATENLPLEFRIEKCPGGVRVFSVLVEWDQIGEAEIAALAQFLVAAQAGLRWARCELADHRVCITSFIRSDSLETDLRHGLLGTSRGSRLLLRSAAALLQPEVARAYLAFRNGPAA